MRGFFDKSRGEIRQTKTIRDYFLHSIENLFYHKLIFNGVFMVIRDCIGINSLHSVIGQ